MTWYVCLFIGKYMLNVFILTTARSYCFLFVLFLLMQWFLWVWTDILFHCCSVPTFSTGLVARSVVFWSKSAPFFWVKTLREESPGHSGLQDVWWQMSEFDNVAKRIKESILSLSCVCALAFSYSLLLTLYRHYTAYNTLLLLRSLSICVPVQWASHTSSVLSSCLLSVAKEDV